MAIVLRFFWNLLAYTILAKSISSAFVVPVGTSRTASISSSISTATTFATISRREWPLRGLIDDNDSSSSSSSSNNNNNSDDDWMLTALKQRQLSLSKDKAEIQQNWRTAQCQQRAMALPDWVRRVSVQWPLAACGSAKGDVYVVHCETGALVGQGQSEQDQRHYADVESSPELARVTKQLFGDFDGGGTLAIAMTCSFHQEYRVAHAGRNREGGVEVWKLDPSSSAMGLISQGMLLEGVLVTSLKWAQEDYLWVGTQDGRVLVYSFDDDDDDDDGDDGDDDNNNGLLPRKPIQEWNNLGGTILSLDYHEELDVTVAACSNGRVEILSLEEPERTNQRLFYPPFDSGRFRSNVFPLCATIVEQQTSSSSSNNNNNNDNDNDNNNKILRQFSVACGGNDGSLFLKPLRLLEHDTIDPELNLEKPFDEELPVTSLKPSHMRPCKCLVSPFPGILLSGGQDGTVRVWDLNKTKTNNNNDAAEDEKNNSGLLYLMAGYKVWLGSLWSDGRYLVMDGCDNAIMVNDFGQSSNDDEGSL